MLKQPNKPHTPISEEWFVNALLGIEQIKQTPIREYCGECREVRSKGKCTNNKCKYGKN